MWFFFALLDSSNRLIIRNNIMKLIEHLPQKAVITPEDAKRWVDGVMRFETERAEWHVDRLSGFGGSDIGAVIRGVSGSRESGFSTLERVVEQKLMKRLPLRQDHNMQRGTVLEELAALALMYRHGAVRDTAAMAKVASGSTRPGYEWLIGNQDDIVFINNKRLIVDYKVPSTFSEDIDFDYVAQLHHYGLMARMAGVKLDGYLLAKMELAPELAKSLVAKFPTMSEADKHQLAKTIATTDVPGMRIVALGVEHRRSMDLDILDIGGYAWEEYVLKGVVPSMKPTELAVLSQEQILNLANLQQQFAMAKSGISHLDTIASQAVSKMGELLAPVDLASQKLPVNIVNISKKNYDKVQLVNEAIARGANESELLPDSPAYLVTALVEEIKRLQGDPVADHLFDRSPDSGKAKTFLESIEGYDVESLRQEGINVLLSRKKADKETQLGMIDSAESAMAPWFERHVIGNDFDADAVVDDQLESWEKEAATGTLLGTELAVASDEESVTHKSPMTKSAGLR
ncbi:hypothetical protein LCGC14_0327950 [marine sediment metagenome]|uniref:YqaJ viral recombinase domain-containing protein n=1 Tax=marine sediment metagenome TaxID=412755 RepID=A0A0F9W4J3_9ZZZZ